MFDFKLVYVVTYGIPESVVKYSTQIYQFVCSKVS